ncbi:TRAFs-binding domain-containing protein [Ferruginibacter yonginensis]|uniref:TRAFs-binding domain-containing protein n=1 Tax=Ferruginibacter yonginensis TaxID=1310416 RepID=A0ABV8QXZ9_9BACT
MSKKKTCFVIIGFGPKTDFETGNIFDLDKTFDNLIKPAFDELDIECFRAKDIRHSGNIDVPMYEWILNADIVIADISTLNPNALYELGVRHALRPNATIVISEDKTKYPFDLNHTLISKYEHLGKDIGVSEAKRFKNELKATVLEVLNTKKNDSPVYTYLPKLQPPKFENVDVKSIKEYSDIQPTLSELIYDAEKAKDNKEFWVAGQLYRVCLKFEPQNIFLRQRLALVTYKLEKPSPKKALLDAEEILSKLNPEETTDPETLGLSGSINKRLFEITKSLKYLDKAIRFYSKGYHIAQDYYNGINYAFLLTTKATIEKNKFEAISYFLQSQRIREEIIELCKELIADKAFKERGDQHWIYQTIAQAYLGLDNIQELNKIIPKIKKYSKGEFDIDTFKEHNEILLENIKNIKKKNNYS